MAKKLKDLQLKNIRLKDLQLKEIPLKELQIKEKITNKLQLKGFAEKMIAQTINTKSQAIQVLLENEEKLDSFLLNAEQIISAIPGFGKYAENIPLLAAMLKSYVKKEYTEVPKGTIIAIIAGLIYVVVPDLLPGFIDDAAVLAFVLKIAGPDLEKYRQWQRDNGRR